jgi:hypothetical protein
MFVYYKEFGISQPVSTGKGWRTEVLRFESW